MIAKKAKIQEDPDETTTLARVKRWLGDEARHPWLMIVDDVEDWSQAAADLGL